MDDDCLGNGVVHVPERRKAGIDTLPRLLPQPSCGVCAQLPDVLVGHTKLDGHHQDVIVRIVAAVVRADMPDYVALEQPLYLPAVYRITSEAINLPTDDALRFAPLYAPKHLVEYGAAGHLRGLLLDIHFRNREIVALRYLAQFGDLAFDGQNLFVLDIGGLAGVEEIEGHIGSIAS